MTKIQEQMNWRTIQCKAGPGLWPEPCRIPTFKDEVEEEKPWTETEGRVLCKSHERENSGRDRSDPSRR